MLDLAGRGAIVAGTRRLGEAVVQRLAREGVRLAILYRRSGDQAEAQAARARQVTDRAVAIPADLSVEADVERAVAQARDHLGDLSFCVNLAFDYPRSPLAELDAAAWERGMAGARSTFLLAVHAARAMQGNRGPTRGHLVFFGDWAAGQTPYLDHLPYLTGKAAVHFMTRAFARELAPHGILVNALAPGPTSRPPDLPLEQWRKALEQAPLHRESSVEDLAELVATLLRLETITGEVIDVDSGRHLAGTTPRESVD